MSALNNPENYAGRVAFAVAFYAAGGGESDRELDNCFENYDGAIVTVALVRLAAKAPAIERAIARDFGGAFPQQWLNNAAKHAAVADRDLPKLAAKVRADKAAETAAWFAARQAEKAAAAAAAADRNRQLVELQAASPLQRPKQHPVDGLALFDVARSPSLFD